MTITGSAPGAVSALFMAICDLAVAGGAPKPLKDHPGLWVQRWAEWEIQLNGHDHTIDAVPPFTALVLRHGLPLACVTPISGTLVGPPEGEDEAIRAIEAETKRIRVP